MYFFTLRHMWCSPHSASQFSNKALTMDMKASISCISRNLLIFLKLYFPSAVPSPPMIFSSNKIVDQITVLYFYFHARPNILSTVRNQRAGLSSILEMVSSSEIADSPLSRESHCTLINLTIDWVSDSNDQERVYALIVKYLKKRKMNKS